MLALFALALQLAVSFAHAHAEDLTGTPLSIASAEHAGAPQVPADDGDSDHHDHYCNICAALLALASAQIATPPHLPAPRTFGLVAAPIEARVAAAEPRRASFRSRAPPIA